MMLGVANLIPFLTKGVKPKVVKIKILKRAQCVMLSV